MKTTSTRFKSVIIASFSVLAIAALVLMGLPYQDASAALSTGTYKTYKDTRNGTNMSSRYHVYANGIDWNKDVGMVYYLDGDYFANSASTFHAPTNTRTQNMAKDANSKNLVFISVESPSPRTAKNGTTWWENGINNAKWFDAFARDMRDNHGISPEHTYVAGYSGGAELISIYLMTEKRYEWVQGGAIMIGGGDKSTRKGPHPANKNVPMYWEVGGSDVGGTNPPGWSAFHAAKAGFMDYRDRGNYTTAKRTLLQGGITHQKYNISALVNKHTKAVR